MISMLTNILVRILSAKKIPQEKFDYINFFHFIRTMGIMDINICNRLSKRPKTHQSGINIPNNGIYKLSITAFSKIKN